MTDLTYETLFRRAREWADKDLLNYSPASPALIADAYEKVLRNHPEGNMPQAILCRAIIVELRRRDAAGVRFWSNARPHLVKTG